MVYHCQLVYSLKEVDKIIAGILDRYIVDINNTSSLKKDRAKKDMKNLLKDILISK